MFRQNNSRTFRHNLGLASMLSLVAGIVNVAGVLAISTLTTNVTGHFAFFAEEVVRTEYRVALAYLSYIASFLSGAFVCGFLVERVIRKNPAKSHTLPLTLEIIILITVAILFTGSFATSEWIARMLLFAMGLQNALVTQISRSIVRTTHLTGLFTDLGIELSQLFFYRKREQVHQLSRSIYLRIAIITCFFFGGVFGGYGFQQIGIKTLLMAGAILAAALFYDAMRKGLHDRRELKSPDFNQDR